jgi:hypothetical protein
MTGKQRRTVFPDQAAWRAERGLELVHGDLCGPISPATPSGNSYFLLLVDDHSRYMWISTLVSKNQAAATIMDFQSRAEGESGHKLSMLCTNRGGEFTSKQFAEYCVQEGVQRQLTAPYSPQQNGVVERRNAMVVGAARSMLKEKGLPGWFWGEAVTTAVYLLNRVPCKAVDGKTPFEVWYGKRPAVHHLKTFGCIVYVRNTKPLLKKLDDRGRKMIFVGYERGTKAYRAYDPVTKKVTITRDVVFDEDAQWDWSSSEQEDVTWHDWGSDIFTVQYREVQAEAVEEGGGPGPDLDIPATPDAVQSDPGSPYGIIHNNPIFEAETDNLDDSYNNEPLRFRSMSEFIGPAVPPGQVPRELSTSESDRLFAVSAEEPTSVMEATQEAVWHRAMVDELQAIEENNT